MADLVQYYGTGRRKSAIARVFLRPGSGNFKVNEKALEAYFVTEQQRVSAVRPLVLTELTATFDVVTTVKGGGVSAQADAVKMGISRALIEFNAELRKTLMALHPGEITNVLRTAEGYRILKVITREPAGQRDLTDPKVQQTIRETLLNRKDQLLKAAYYEVARNEAKVVNYFAARVVGNRERK